MHSSIHQKNAVQNSTHLFIEDWLSGHNHKGNRDETIPGMFIIINTI